MELELIKQFEPIELGYRLIGVNSFDCHTVTKFEFERAVVFEHMKHSRMKMGCHTRAYVPPQVLAHLGVLRNFRRRKLLETLDKAYTHRTTLTKGTTFGLRIRPKNRRS